MRFRIITWRIVLAAILANFSALASPLPAPQDTTLGPVTETLEAFLRAPDGEARLALSYRGEALRPEMEAHYQEHDLKTYERYSLQFSDLRGEPGSPEAIWIYYLSESDEDAGFPVFVRVEDDFLKVDWELFVEFQDRRFASFLRGERGETGIFRIGMQRRTGYYGPDRESFVNVDDFHVFELTPPYGDQGEFTRAAFVHADDPIARQLDLVAPFGGVAADVTLVLERVALPHGVDHLVIRELRQDGWIAPDPAKLQALATAMADDVVFVSRKQDVYRARFSAQPDDDRFMILRLPTPSWPDAANFVVKIGETTEDGQLRVDGFTRKNAFNDLGIEVDVSTVDVVHLPTNTSLKLVRGVSTDIKTNQADLRYRPDPLTLFTVPEGGTFFLPDNPAIVFTIDRVLEKGVTISFELPGAAKVNGR